MSEEVKEARRRDLLIQWMCKVAAPQHVPEDFDGISTGIVESLCEANALRICLDGFIPDIGIVS